MSGKEIDLKDFKWVELKLYASRGKIDADGHTIKVYNHDNECIVYKTDATEEEHDKYRDALEGQEVDFSVNQTATGFVGVIEWGTPVNLMITAHGDRAIYREKVTIVVEDKNDDG